MGRPGKYAAIIDKLPKLGYVSSEAQDPDYQARVNAVKSAIFAPEDRPPGFQQMNVDDVQHSLKEIKDTVGTLVAGFIAVNDGKRYGSKFADTWTQLRGVKEALEGHVSSVNLVLEAYAQLLIDQYEVEGVTSLKLDNEASVGVQQEPHAQVQDKEALRLWCIKEGLEKSLALPWQTLNAMTKERLLEGRKEPPGVVAHARSKIVLRR